MKVTLVVKVLDATKRLVGAYYRMINIAFVPTIGMKFKQAASLWLWKTADGSELSPPITEIVYNLDEKEIYCLFEIDQFLASNFWTQIKNLKDNYELSQFETHNVAPEVNQFATKS